MGFGADSRLHTAKVLRLSEDLPIVVEIADKPEKIEEFLPALDRMVEEGMITLEKVHVPAYRHNDENRAMARIALHVKRACNGKMRVRLAVLPQTSISTTG